MYSVKLSVHNLWLRKRALLQGCMFHGRNNNTQAKTKCGTAILLALETVVLVAMSQKNMSIQLNCLHETRLKVELTCSSSVWLIQNTGASKHAPATTA